MSMSVDPATLREVPPQALGDEWTILEPDFAEYGRRHGMRPSVLALGGSRGAGGGAFEGFVVRYPKLPPGHLPPGAYLYQTPAHFAAGALRAHLASLGFFADEDRCVRTVPTPRTFGRLMEAAGLVDRGYRAAVVRTRSAAMPASDWLAHVLDGTYPTNVASPMFYRACRWVERTPLRRVRGVPGVPGGLRIELADVGLLAHDAGVHVLALHLIPREDVAELAERIRRALREHGVRSGDDEVLEPVGRFFEEDLTLHCQTLWREARSVAEFDAAYARSRDAMFASLARRLSPRSRTPRHGAP